MLPHLRLRPSIIHTVALCVSLGATSLSTAADAPAKGKGPQEKKKVDHGPTYTDPAKTDADFAIQGEYAGMVGDKAYGVQVLALGDGQFEAVAYPGGLPGDGWTMDPNPAVRGTGKRETPDGPVVFVKQDSGVRGEVDGQRLLVFDAQGTRIAELARTDRQSPTLDAKPPQGAIVLFDGSDTSHFPAAKMTEDKRLMAGATSSDKFQSFTMHIEFRLPYMPKARGQARGNSGLYLQGRYEVQMLDSFALKGENNECGGIYKAAAPKVNMCYPPLTWQTYDVDFSAAKFDVSGKKTANARVTVKHNGVVIHEDQEISGGTPGGPIKEESSAPGPIYLQNHGNPVVYRNIWVLPKE